MKYINIQGAISKEQAMPANLITSKPNQQVVFEQVIAEDAGKRQGTHSTLGRGEVRGGGKKPRPQKHTGAAQLGSTRASHCVGGGCAFGPKPYNNYKLYLNHAASKLALKSVLTIKENEGNIYVLQDNVSSTQTKVIKNLLKALSLEGKKVLIVGEKDLIKSSRNIHRVESKLPTQTSVKDILNANVVIFSEIALGSIEGMVK
jgi:large subunit ribosomal protein L4